MDKVLVLGSEGYLGSVLIPYLNKLNLDIVGVDRCFFGKKNLNKKNFKLIRSDYCNLSEKFLNSFNYIIDLVNISNDPASELNKKFTYKTNYLNKVKFIKKIKKNNNLEKYIYLSSCSVYGHNKKMITEKSKTSPISLYSKLCFKYENYFKSKIKNYTILRLGTLFGWSRRMRYDIAINKIIRDMVYNKKIEIYGGEQQRFFCYNMFACEIIYKLLKNKLLNKNKILNIGIFNTNIINLVKEILLITKIKNVNIIHEKFNIDKRSYKVSLNTSKKLINKKFDLKKYSKKAILETFNKIKKDKNPFSKNKITLEVYKDYLKKNDKFL